ncbi:hypothetical protein CES85_1496 [Ochrobactrum quorumnocens]|uniref:Uncharacterized protein n=1 Tax=Ochrobactrum quorumnocens TaxID=271865 RepID=A0A248UJG6_9HYPH|nr:hypothetical protein CES85_1496 [[Ochrobactrum] quorumnocens]
MKPDPIRPVTTVIFSSQSKIQKTVSYFSGCISTAAYVIDMS